MKLITSRHAETVLPSEIVLRIELVGISPSVWRRVAVHSEATLEDLHHIIQAAMGWCDTHSHDFLVGEVYYRANPSSEDPTTVTVRHERRKKLRLVARETDLFTYIYDWGDEWQHRISIEQIRPRPPQRLAYVEAGERACPPEDSGGIPGYLSALEALDQPKSAAAKEFLEWAGPDFDPARFDRHAANAALSRMHWNRWVGLKVSEH